MRHPTCNYQSVFNAGRADAADQIAGLKCELDIANNLLCGLDKAIRVALKDAGLEASHSDRTPSWQVLALVLGKVAAHLNGEAPF